MYREVKTESDTELYNKVPRIKMGKGFDHVLTFSHVTCSLVFEHDYLINCLLKFYWHKENHGQTD